MRNSLKVVRNNKFVKYYKDGRLHRTDGPAIEYFTEDNLYREVWYYKGKIHREGAPAITYHDGTTAWYRNGLLHRDDGPAYHDTDDNSETWYYKGDIHRLGGPAIFVPNSETNHSYFLYGIALLEEDYREACAKYKLCNILLFEDQKIKRPQIKKIREEYQFHYW